MIRTRKRRRFGRALGAVGLATAASTPVLPPAPVSAVMFGYFLPLEQTAFNNNYGPAGGCCPMNAQTCHHNACNSVPNTFWAIDLFQGLDAPEYAWTTGTVQYAQFDSSCGNLVRWGTTIAGDPARPGLSSMYCHGNSIVGGLAQGQWVQLGQTLMKMGKTGTGANNTIHLHFDYRYLGRIDTFGGVNPVSGAYNGYCTRLFLNRINNDLSPDPAYGYTTTYGTINGTCS